MLPFTNLLNSTKIFLSNNLRNIITTFIIISLVAAIVVVGGNTIITTTATTNTTGVAEERTYILVFGHRTVGNIDNSTKIVSSIVGNNSVKIQEEFLEELSLAPSQQLQDQIEKIVNDGISGGQCNATLTTQEGENVN